MAIDYDDAQKRIILAFIKGMIRTYGTRRMVKHTQKFMRPGKLYWDKDEEWEDPKGKRKGRFKRGPSVEAEQEIEIPEGVEPEEMLKLGSAMCEAFVETLRIAEENGLTLGHGNPLPKQGELDAIAQDVLDQGAPQ
jgi:hypothetical protein